MCSCFHHHKFALGDGLQFVWRHERSLHHLQGLAALFPLTDGAGEHRAAAKGGGEGLGGFALGRKAAEDGVLAVVTYNFRTFFTIVLLQLGKALDDGNQRQPAGAARAEQGQDVEGRHGAQLIAEQHHAVLEPAVMLVRHGEQLAGQVLDHKARDEILGGIFLRQNEKNGALLRGEHLRVDGAVVADDLLQLRIQKGVQAGEDGGHDRGHCLIRRCQRRARQPPCLMLRRQNVHQQLKAVPAP